MSVQAKLIIAHKQPRKSIDTESLLGKIQQIFSEKAKKFTILSTDGTGSTFCFYAEMTYYIPMKKRDVALSGFFCFHKGDSLQEYEGQTVFSLSMQNSTFYEMPFFDLATGLIDEYSILWEDNDHLDVPPVHVDSAWLEKCFSEEA